MAPPIPRVMKNLPATEDPLVLRTDFSDQSAWEAVVAAVQQPVGEFRAYVEFIDDPEYTGLTAEELPAVPSDDPDRSFAFIIDHVALSHPEHPILVVDLFDEPGRVFRVIPSKMWSVGSNLSIANMGFEEFTEAADDEGIFRGFPNP
jgi:hypothetical protein